MHDNDSIKEAWELYEEGELSAMQMMREFEDWDGDPIEIIG
jgi:hypothetical protein